MSPNKERQLEAEHFRSELEGILSVPLSPENIDNFADDALDELVGFVQSVQDSFQGKTTQAFSTQRELENAAFKLYGLEDIEEILDHVADKSEELRDLDDLIGKVSVDQAVLVPPDLQSFIEPGDDPRALESARTVPRLKTLLFVLSNEFELDVYDEEAVTIKTGTNSNSMARGESYNLVDIPSMQRCVLVCDEVGNTTFVLDRASMEDVDISPAEMATLTKSEIKDLLSEHPALGEKLVYHENTYVPKLINLLSSEGEVFSEQDASPNYLRPVAKAPTGVLSISRLAKKWESNNGAISQAIEELADDIGEISQYRFGVRTTFGLTPEQQATIYSHLESKGLMAEKAPEGVFSAKGLYRQWGVDRNLIAGVIEEIGEELGEVEQYRFHNVYTPGYSPEQQAIIYSHLEERGLFADKAPESFLSVAGLVEEFDAAPQSIKKAVEELGEELGEITKYRFGTYYTTGFSPQQQSLIYAHLEAKGQFIERAPEGILSANGLAKQLGVKSRVITRTIAGLGDDLGEMPQYRFGYSNITGGLNPRQQAVIREHLEK